EGTTTILYLIPEGTFVKPGDLLVELNAADLVDKRVAQEINVQNAEATFIKAEASYDVQESQNLTDVEKAQRTFDFAKIDLEKDKLQKYVDQIAKAKIKAREPGMVVYTRVDSGRMGSDPIQEGTQVRERQEILTIPRTEALIVEASVHESVLKRVEIGKPCKIRVDAIPSCEFDGNVQFVALLPDKGSWWANTNQRLYRTEISV